MSIYDDTDDTTDVDDGEAEGMEPPETNTESGAVPVEEPDAEETDESEPTEEASDSEADGDGEGSEFDAEGAAETATSGGGETGAGVAIVGFLVLLFLFNQSTSDDGSGPLESPGPPYT